MSIYEGEILSSCCFWSPCSEYFTNLLQSHSGLEGFGSPSPAAPYETPPERAAAAPQTDWFPVAPARTCAFANTSYTHTHLWDTMHVLLRTNADLKAVSSSDRTAFSLSDAVSWTTSAALSRTSSARPRPVSSKATWFRWLSPLARLSSDSREVTSAQSWQKKAKQFKRVWKNQTMKYENTL